MFVNRLNLLCFIKKKLYAYKKIPILSVGYALLLVSELRIQTSSQKTVVTYSHSNKMRCE